MLIAYLPSCPSEHLPAVPLAADLFDFRAIVTMASVSKSVLVEHSAQQMFDLVERVEDYPEFLPWCGGTAILERTPAALVARIDINYHGVRAHFTTANRNERPERIVIELRDGPFRR